MSVAAEQPQHPELQQKASLKPRGEMGAGEPPYMPPLARGALRPCSPGECGDWEAMAADDSRIGSTTTTTEYLTPDSSFFSLELFYSTLENLPGDQPPAESPRVSEKQPPELPWESSDKAQEVGAERCDTWPVPLANKEGLVTQIGGELGLPIDVRNMPSPASLLSCSSVCFLGKAYRHLNDDGGSYSDVSASCGGGPSTQQQSASDGGGSLSSGGHSSPAPHHGVLSSTQSSMELVPRIEEDAPVAHIKQPRQKRHGRHLWVSLWAGLRRRLQQWTLRRRRKVSGQGTRLLQHGQATHKGAQGGGSRNNSNSNEPSMSRSLYNRFVSYLRMAAGRG